MANECVPYFKPGDDFTGLATGAITGKRFVELDAAATAWAPEGLRATAIPNVPPVKQVGTSGNRPLGVAQRDHASGEKTGIFSGNCIVPVTAGAAVAAGAQVQSDASGRAITLAAGVSAGIALNAAAALGDTIAVKLNL